MAEVPIHSNVPATAVPAAPTWPATFAELNGQAGVGNDDHCHRCRTEPATHSVGITVHRLGESGGAMAARRKARLCEACAVRIYGPVARALS